MGLQKWINDIFGINNEVSAPILITLAVFITGGLVKLIFDQINAFLKRKSYRNTFYSIVEEIIKDCGKKERQIQGLLPTLNIDHKSHWTLSYSKLKYANQLFNLPFEIIYGAYEKIFFCQCKKAIKRKAFHEIYSLVENVNYFDSYIRSDMEEFIQIFNRRHDMYNQALASFNTLRDNFSFQIQGQTFTKGAGGIDDYAIEANEIWKKWLELDEKERVHYKITYDYLVKPLLAMNKKFNGLGFTLEQNVHLLECSAQFVEMENVMKRVSMTFENHYYNFRITKRKLKKCLDIIK